MMFWVALAVLAILGSVLARRRRIGASLEEEPWRASLLKDDANEPLDMDEIRRAEEEWSSGGGPFEGDEEDWV